MVSRPRLRLAVNAFLVVLGCRVAGGQWACLEDDFETGTSSLLTEPCDETLNNFFVVRRYDEGGGAAAPPPPPDAESTRYLTDDADGNRANCARSRPIPVVQGVRLSFTMVGFHEGAGLPSQCFLNVNDEDGAYVSSNSTIFGSSRDWFEFHAVMSRTASAIVSFECSPIPTTSLLAIDSIKITAETESECQELFPTTTSATTTEATTTAITLPTTLDTTTLPSTLPTSTSMGVTTTDAALDTTTVLSTSIETTTSLLTTTEMTTSHMTTSTAEITTDGTVMTTMNTESTIGTEPTSETGTSTLGTTIVTELTTDTESTTSEVSTSTNSSTESTVDVDSTPSVEQTTITDVENATTTNEPSTPGTSTPNSPPSTPQPPPVSSNRIWKSVGLIAIAFTVANFCFMGGMAVYLTFFKRPLSKPVVSNSDDSYSETHLPRLRVIEKKSTVTGETIIQISGSEHFIR